MLNEDVLSDGDDTETEDGQLTLQQSFDHTRQRAMEHVTDRFQDLLNIDNETLKDAKEMEAVYDDVRADPLYKKLLAMANVHTAEAFGLNLPGDADERMARALHSDAWENIEEQDWFKSAQAMAEDECFFHWELEFPIAFYDQDGGRKTDAGFDAVVGNPPYSSGRDWGSTNIKNYFEKKYQSAQYQIDLYHIFMEESLNLSKKQGLNSYIVPDTWTNAMYSKNLRELILDNSEIKQIVDLPPNVFSDATVDTLIYVISKETSENNNIVTVKELDEKQNRQEIHKIKQNKFKQNEEYIIDFLVSPVVRKVLEKVETKSVNLGDICETKRGINAYDKYQGQSEETIKNRAYHSDKQTDQSYSPLLMGKDVGRYTNTWNKNHWIKYGKWLAAPREERLFKQPKLLVRKLLSNGRIVSYVDEDDYFVDQQLYIAIGSGEYDLNYLCAICNSKLVTFCHVFENREFDVEFPQITVNSFKSLPIPEIQFDNSSKEQTKSTIIYRSYEDIVNNCLNDLSHLIELSEDRTEGVGGNKITHDIIRNLSTYMKENNRKKHKLNMSLLDHLGNYSEGHTLTEIGLAQPPSGSAESILQQTAKEKPNLRVGTVNIDRESETTVEILLSARYKPENKDAHETDQ